MKLIVQTSMFNMLDSWTRFVFKRGFFSCYLGFTSDILINKNIRVKSILVSSKTELSANPVTALINKNGEPIIGSTAAT